MSAILDLPEMRDRVFRLPVETYEMLGEMGALDKRVELIRGVIIKKMSKSDLHCKISRLIYRFLLAWERAGFVVLHEEPLRLADSEPEPDVMIVSGPQGAGDNIHPTTAELVVEVAVSSAAADREMASLYAEAGVKEYWIVLANEKQVEVYRQPSGGTYQQKQTYSAAEALACESVPGLQAPLADWFA